jgi:hypothetical protein
MKNIGYDPSLTKGESCETIFSLMLTKEEALALQYLLNSSMNEIKEDTSIVLTASRSLCTNNKVIKLIWNVGVIGE